jgi:hypothetical protein
VACSRAKAWASVVVVVPMVGAALRLAIGDADWLLLNEI